jgi:hypothetical protein
LAFGRELGWFQGIKMNKQRIGMHAAVLACLGILSSINFVLADEPLSTRIDSGATSREPVTQLPTWLWGEWSRDWVQKGNAKSNLLDVRYLQTPTYFADMRIPKDRPSFSTARSFGDLTDQQLRWLARQSGYSGRTTMEGTIATWHEDIIFQPSDGTPDMGRLQRISRVRMHEHGLDGSYIESWKSLTGRKGPFLVIRVEHSGRLLRTLVVVDNEFLYVRNRAKDLPTAKSFDALIEATNANREQMVAYLDCEFSAGRVRGGSVPWEVEKSTLPWREGLRLDFVERISVKRGGAKLVPREVGEDQWTVPVNTMSPHDINAFFGG